MDIAPCSDCQVKLANFVLASFPVPPSAFQCCMQKSKCQKDQGAWEQDLNLYDCELCYVQDFKSTLFTTTLCILYLLYSVEDDSSECSANKSMKAGGHMKAESRRESSSNSGNLKEINNFTMLMYYTIIIILYTMCNIIHSCTHWFIIILLYSRVPNYNLLHTKADNCYIWRSYWTRRESACRGTDFRQKLQWPPN